MAFETLANRYAVERRLGRGGMGDVWLATDLLLDRQVALKFVGQNQLRGNPAATKVLHDEAKAGGRLTGHPQVVAVLDLIEVSGILHTGPTIVMEYVDGCTLAEWIASDAPRLDDQTRLRIALFIALESTEAIHEAHKMGILHRDIKPLNVLCSMNGRVKVADFGLARVVEEITRTHTVWNFQSPLYSAPEQWRGEKPDLSTDIYQLCATLYHLFAGQPANQGKNQIELMRWHENGELIALSKLAPQLEDNVASTVMSGLADDPNSRPVSWRIFDVLSNALMRQVRLKVDVENCSSEQITEIASLTDFNEDSLRREGSHTVKFYNPLEASREALAVALQGGLPTLEELS